MLDREIYMQHRSLLDRYEFQNFKGITEFTDHSLSRLSMWRSCDQLSGVKDRHLLIQDYLKFMLFFELQVLCNQLSCQSCTGKGLKTKVKKQRKFKLCRKITSNYWVKVFKTKLDIIIVHHLCLDYLPQLHKFLTFPHP